MNKKLICYPKLTWTNKIEGSFTWNDKDWRLFYFDLYRTGRQKVFQIYQVPFREYTSNIIVTYFETGVFTRIDHQTNDLTVKDLKKRHKKLFFITIIM